MAVKLEDLVLRIRADSRQLQRELRSVEARNRRATSTVAKQWSGASKGIAGASSQLLRFTGLGAAVGAGLSFAGLKSQVEETLALADSVDKTALRLGLGTEALQEFRFAASQSGVETRTLDLAIQRFTRRAGEAANGTGEAKDAIKELRLELRGTDGQIRRTEDLFSDAITALAGIENPAEKLRLAFKLFDSEGVSVLQLADDFEALRKEARELGVVIDAQTIKSAVEAKDRLSALALAIQADLAPALVDLAPVLVNVSEGMAQVAGFASKFFGSFQDANDLSVQSLITQMGVVGAELGDLDTRLKAAREARDQVFEGGLLNRGEGFFKTFFGSLAGEGVPFLETQFEEASRRFEELQAEFKRRTEASAGGESTAPGLDPVAFGAARKAIDSIEAQISGLERLRSVRGDAEAQERIAEIIEIENRARTANVDLTTEQGQRYLELSLVLAGLTDDSESYSSAQQNVNRILLAGRTPAQALAEDIARLRDDFEEGRISAEALDASVASLNTKFEEARKKSGKAAKGFFAEMEGLGDAFVSNFSKSMADMLLTGELTFQALASSFARDFTAAVIQSLITNSIASVFGSTTGGGLFGGIGGRAAGGPIQAGVPYVVGEKGPELIVPKSSGFVIPNGSLRAPSAVGALAQPAPMIAPPASVSVTVINETDGQASVSERTGPSGQREIQVLISRAVAGEISQGGPIARAIDARVGARPRGS